MNDLHTSETTVLVDLLATYTEKYTRFLTEKRASDEFNECKQMIAILQEEIQSRHRKVNSPRLQDHFLD